MGLKEVVEWIYFVVLEPLMQVRIIISHVMEVLSQGNINKTLFSIIIS